jgi:O-succinylbenzoic acid--CoA ligase
LFATSGSSGTPKWIALSKTALLASATAVNHHLNVTSASCWGLALPPHHVGGFGVAARAFAADCGWCAFAGRWDASAFAAWLAANRVTHTSLVPTQIHDLVATRRHAPASLRAIVVGGGHLDTATGQAARALGWPVLASYGMTEAASQIATQGLDFLQTLYQPAPLPLLPIWQAKTFPEHLLRIAGPALFSGLLVREHDQWAFIPRVTQWHQTQDRVMLANGTLTVVGRADTLVKVLGELVDPVIIEREIVALAAGKLVPGSLAVIAVPDARAEHTLVPVFDGSVDTALIAAVLTDYARQAPGFRRLRPPVILQNFPSSPMGKPRREAITAAITALQTPCE